MNIELTGDKTETEFNEIYNQDTNKGIQYACDGHNLEHAAWRYAHIHAAVEKMGGWANYKYWTNRHSLSHFNTCKEMESHLIDLAVKMVSISKDTKESPSVIYALKLKEARDKVKLEANRNRNPFR